MTISRDSLHSVKLNKFFAESYSKVETFSNVRIATDRQLLEYLLIISQLLIFPS